MSSLRPRSPLSALAALLLVAPVLVGCSADAEVEPTPTPTAAPVAEEPEPEPEPEPTETVEPAPEWVSQIATATGDTVEVFDSADATEPARTIEAADIVSLPGQIPLTFLVVEQQDGRVHVHLPVRPNGTTGWLSADAVTLSETDLQVEVRLSEHRLLLHQAGEVVMDVPVGLGQADLPTPGGVYYIKELLQPPTPGGVYGAYAYGLSGYSPVLESFAGGPGVIGIHGTNQPDSVGTDASHGCIRMHDADVTRLVEEFGLPLGTPVEIKA